MNRFCILALIAGFASPAYAADAPVDAAPAPVAFDWSGFYAGVHLGYGSGEISFNTGSFEEDAEGVIAGGQIGYNFQIDNFVLGVQTDIAYSDIRSDEDGAGEDDTVDWLGSTTLKLGYALDRVLVYGKGGVAYGEGTGYTGATPMYEDSNTHVGWTAGAGVELAFTEKVTGFVEYDYTDLGESTYEFPTVPGGVDVEMQLHTVKTGINLHF